MAFARVERFGKNKVKDQYRTDSMSDPLNEVVTSLQERPSRKVLFWWMAALLSPLVICPIAGILFGSLMPVLGLGEMGAAFCFWQLPYSVKAKLLCICVYVPVSLPFFYLVARCVSIASMMGGF
jgi:hypothetical protein